MSIPKVKVGVLGATGAVGQRFVQMLQGHPWFEITALCASERSAGKRYADACTWISAATCRAICTMSSSNPASRLSTPNCSSACCLRSRPPGRMAFAQAGYGVCSNARSYRYEPDVPLLIPEVNPEHIQLIDVQKRKRGWTGLLPRTRIAARRIWSARCTAA